MTPNVIPTTIAVFGFRVALWDSEASEGIPAKGEVAVDKLETSVGAGVGVLNAVED